MIIEVLEKKRAFLNLALEKLVSFSEVTDITGWEQSLHEFLEDDHLLFWSEDVLGGLNGSFERGTEDEIDLLARQSLHRDLTLLFPLFSDAAVDVFPRKLHFQILCPNWVLRQSLFVGLSLVVLRLSMTDNIDHILLYIFMSDYSESVINYKLQPIIFIYSVCSVVFLLFDK